MKCPECGEEISSLVNCQSGEKDWVFTVEDGKPEYGASKFYTDDKENRWECPECQHTITHDEGEAIKFLGGRK